MIYATPTAPSLGAAGSFSVLAAKSMAANGSGTQIDGDLGLSPGLAGSRTGNWTVGGAEYFGTSSQAFNAQADALSAFGNLAGQSSDGVLFANNSPAPGVYTAAADTTFSGTLTLNGGYDDVWIFQVGNDMTFTGSVVMAGNAQACHVFWQIGNSAVINSDSTFVGTLIASADITVHSNSIVYGRLISLNSSLVMESNNKVLFPPCAGAPATASTRKLTIYKVDLSGNPIVANANSTAVFDIYTSSDINGNPFREGSLIDGTNFVKESLKRGTYWVVEKSAPAGYDVAPMQTVIISSGNASLTFKDGPTVAAAAETTTAAETAVTAAAAAEETTVETTPVTTTVTGGQIPKTSTPWYNILITGAALILIGAMGWWITRKINGKNET